MEANGDRFPGNNKTLITEEKLLLFLQEVVVGRSRRKRGRKAQEAEEGEDGDGNISKVGIQTYKNYVSAAVAIWKHQRLLKVLSHIAYLNLGKQSSKSKRRYDQDVSPAFEDG
jgi:hypothetical protein